MTSHARLPIADPRADGVSNRWRAQTPHVVTHVVARRCDVIHFDDVINAKINQSEASKGAKVDAITTCGFVCD